MQLDEGSRANLEADQVLALPLTGKVTLDKQLQPWKPQLPHLLNGATLNTAASSVLGHHRLAHTLSSHSTTLPKKAVDTPAAEWK